MNVSLTPELEKLVSDEVKSGNYSTASEVVREGLRLLKREKMFHYFRAQAQKGIDAIEAGDYTVLETTEDYARFAEEVEREGRRILQQRKKRA